MTEAETQAAIEATAHGMAESMMGRNTPLALVLVIPVWQNSSGYHAYPVMLGDTDGCNCLRTALLELIGQIEQRGWEKVTLANAPGGDG